SRAALAQGKKVIRAARDVHSKNSPEWHDIDYLLARVGNLQREAIGAGLRKCASNIASRHAQLGDAREIGERLQVAYNVRSTLLHEGRTNDISRSLGFLREFVPRLLEALYSEVAGVAQP